MLHKVIILIVLSGLSRSFIHGSSNSKKSLLGINLRSFSYKPDGIKGYNQKKRALKLLNKASCLEVK